MIDKHTLLNILPLVGTLIGGVIGLTASLLAARYSNKSSEYRSRSDRDRVRIERLYKILSLMKRDASEALLHAQRLLAGSMPDFPEIKFHEGNHENLGFPPYAELEMLVGLYYKNLETSRHNLISAIQELNAKKWLIRMKYRGVEVSLESGSTMNTFEELDKDIEVSHSKVLVEIEKFQVLLVEYVKA